MSPPTPYCLKVPISAIYEKWVTNHGWTNRWTDQWTDKASYRDAWTHLKNEVKFDGAKEFQLTERKSSFLVNFFLKS